MVLLDTCTLLWLVGDSTRLSARAREQLQLHAGSIFVSAISAFEVGVKHRKGNLGLPQEPAVWFRKALELHGLLALSIDWQIAELATALPRIHADLCDRLLIATAQARNLLLLTPDPLIHAYSDLRVAW